METNHKCGDENEGVKFVRETKMINKIETKQSGYNRKQSVSLERKRRVICNIGWKSEKDGEKFSKLEGETE